MKKEYVLFGLFPISQIMIFVGNVNQARSMGFRMGLSILVSILADCFILHYLIKALNADETEKNSRKQGFCANSK